jgi:hypothetical protein
MGPAVLRRPGGSPKSGTDQSPPRAACGGCATVYEPAAWLDLHVVSVLTGEAIAAHVVKWPGGVRIEVRRCSRCGRSIARTEGSGPR